MKEYTYDKYNDKPDIYNNLYQKKENSLKTYR